MQLSPRLQAIYNHIACRVLADIGTDHAYLPIALLQDSKIQSAIAADLNPGPLKIAAENIKKYNLQNQISLRLGDGLAPLNCKEVDTILIAGMGGELILKILGAHMDIAKSADLLILQPMNAQYELRKWLIQNGFTIIKEDLAREGYKIYNILLVQNGTMPPPEKEIEYHLPKSLQSHPDYAALYAKKHREFTKIRNGQLAAANPNQALLTYYTELLAEAERIKP